VNVDGVCVSARLPSPDSVTIEHVSVVVPWDVLGDLDL
jgi:hypothetical protein